MKKLKRMVVAREQYRKDSIKAVYRNIETGHLSISSLYKILPCLSQDKRQIGVRVYMYLTVTSFILETNKKSKTAPSTTSKCIFECWKESERCPTRKKIAPALVRSDEYGRRYWESGSSPVAVFSTTHYQYESSMLHQHIRGNAVEIDQQSTINVSRVSLLTVITLTTVKKFATLSLSLK